MTIGRVHGADEPMETRYVVLGLLSGMEDGIVTGLHAGARVGGVAQRQAARAVGVGVPASLRVLVEPSARRLDQRGRRVVALARGAATHAGEAAAARLAREPALVAFVEQFVRDLQDRVLDIVLPDVFDRLASEPEQLQAIVREQSHGIFGEAVRTTRARAVAADGRVDAWMARLRRAPQS